MTTTTDDFYDDEDPPMLVMPCLPIEDIVRVTGFARHNAEAYQMYRSAGMSAKSAYYFAKHEAPITSPFMFIDTKEDFDRRGNI